MIIPHVNNETRDNAIKFTEAMAKVMSEDKSHQDGLGYAAIDSHQFNYNKFGDVRLDDMSAITLHTRLATSGKGLLNCHPFIENDTSVIHNGMISKAFDFRI